MTFRELGESHCVSKGMSREQAVAVVKAYAESELGAAMVGRWEEDVAGYATPVLTVTLVGINVAATEYIEKNCPRAWFKSLFDGSSDRTRQ